MHSLYLTINLCSFVVPFLFSFHPKLKFYRKWKSLLPATLVMMAFYISWDIIFTQKGFWGFNPDYVTGYQLGGMPFEEWLFFLCITYSCIFSYYALLYFFPKIPLRDKTTSIIYVFLQTAMIVSLFAFYDRLYTAVNFGYTLVLLALVYNFQRKTLNSFFPIFAIILIPFLIVNGILTGTGIDEPVVWYDNSQNMGVRILTIPIEDSMYAIGMLLTVLVIIKFLEAKFWSEKK